LNVLGSLAGIQLNHAGQNISQFSCEVQQLVPSLPSVPAAAPSIPYAARMLEAQCNVYSPVAASSAAVAVRVSRT
jgi:hypothetical protein